MESMEKYCLSCGAPLGAEGFKGMAEEYCRHCTDDAGRLKSRDEIRMGIAYWLKTWQPDLDENKAAARANHYMKAMPAWAD